MSYLNGADLFDVGSGCRARDKAGTPHPYLDMWEIEEEEAAAWPLPVSRRATWTMTLPVRIPLKMAMASECDRPEVECPFTERISSPAERERGGIPDKHGEHKEA